MDEISTVKYNVIYEELKDLENKLYRKIKLKTQFQQF